MVRRGLDADEHRYIQTKTKASPNNATPNCSLISCAVNLK